MASNPQRVTHVTSMPGLSTTALTALGGGGMWPGGGGHWWDREGGAARGASHPPPATLRPRGTDGNVPGRRKVSPASKRGQGGCGGARAPGGVTPATAPPAWQGSGPGAGGGVPKAVLPGKGGGPQLPCPGHRSPVPPHGSGKVGAAPHQPPQVWVHSCTPILREGCEEGGLQPPGAPGTARAR